MKPTTKHELLAILTILLFGSCFISQAEEPGGTKSDDMVVPHSIGESGQVQETYHATHAEEAERYVRLYKEYLEAVNNAKNDEERLELRRKFDEKTKSYQEFLANENETLNERNRQRKKEALQDDYQRERRFIQQKYEREKVRAKSDCREAATGLSDNWLTLETIETAECKKARSLDASYQRDIKLLEKDYNAKLKALQNQ